MRARARQAYQYQIGTRLSIKLYSTAFKSSSGIVGSIIVFCVDVSVLRYSHEPVSDTVDYAGIDYAGVDGAERLNC